MIFLIKHKKLIIAAAVLALGVAMAISTLAMVDEVLGLGESGQEIEVTVSRGDTADQIVQKLADAGVIKFKGLFSLFLKVTKSESKLKNGTYTLRADMDYLLLSSQLKKSGKNTDEVQVTIAEGLTQKQIFALLEENGVCTVSALEEYAKKCDLPFEKSAGQYRLEGYLYPDTYRFYQSDSAKAVIDKILANFSQKFSSDLAQKAAEKGLTPYEVLTLASVVEKEAAGDADREKVASVFINRLENWDKPLLQSCATVLYALGENKEVLSYTDIAIDSPYNTYKYEGLTPGPISSPGIASIKAVLEPEQTDYYYFVADGKGGHIFSKTYTEHVDAVMAT